MIETGLLITLITIVLIYFAKSYNVIIQRLNRLIIENKTLEEDDIKVLLKFNAFYLSLSPHLRYFFEERLALYMYSRQFLGIDIRVTNKMKVLIAGYAAQLTIGIPNFEFKRFKLIKLYKGSFSLAEGVYQTWLIDEKNDTLHISWPDFYSGVRIKLNEPALGLEIMSRLLQIENNDQKFLHLQIDSNENIHHYTHSFYNQLVLKSDFELFSKSDLYSIDNFTKACILYFHTSPIKLKSCYPRLFDELNKVVYQEFLEAA